MSFRPNGNQCHFDRTGTNVISTERSEWRNLEISRLRFAPLEMTQGATEVTSASDRGEIERARDDTECDRSR